MYGRTHFDHVFKSLSVIDKNLDEPRRHRVHRTVVLKHKARNSSDSFDDVGPTMIRAVDAAAAAPDGPAPGITAWSFGFGIQTGQHVEHDG